MSKRVRYYSLSGAANILQVKRDQLLTIESYLPELQTCALRPSAEHYNSEDFALLQAIVSRMHIHRFSLEESIKQYLIEHHQYTGEVVKQHKTKKTKTLTEEKNKAPKKESKSTKKRTKKKKSNLEKSVEKDDFDAPADWYYNKLYSEAQGQKSFSFDNPVTMYSDSMLGYNKSVPQKAQAYSEDSTNDIQQDKYRTKENKQKKEALIAKHTQDLTKEEELLSQKTPVQKKLSKAQEQSSTLENQERNEPIANKSHRQGEKGWKPLNFQDTDDKSFLEKLSGLEKMLEKKNLRLSDSDASDAKPK